MSKYILGASSDIGFERESQEDFIQFKELDNNNMLAIISDGTGSVKEHLQPATMATMSVISEINDIYTENAELLLGNPLFFLKRAIINANKQLGALKLGNEEIYSGYAASITCALLDTNNKIHIAHAGNTRFYIMRDAKLIQITSDHTKAQKLFDEGEIDANTFHVHPDRLKMTSGVGMISDPEIMTITCSKKENDLIVMTSDGIHYAIRPDAMTQIILDSGDCVLATKNLIEAARDVLKYPDNMSAIIIQ